MERLLKQSLWTLIVMSTAAGSVPLLQPAASAPAAYNGAHIVSAFPDTFAQWRVDPSVIPIMPSRDLTEKMGKIYEKTVVRTYVNRQGQRVMLSVAYGSNQTGRLRVHRPESCYTAQGFAVQKLRDENVQVGGGIVPVKRLLATSGSRIEPITYWIRVGDETVTGLLGQRLAQLKRGLSGDVPDGLIVRVSTLGRDSAAGFQLQDQFVRDLLGAMPPQSQYRLAGVGGVRVSGVQHVEPIFE
jgi:EpsI family protein